MIRDEDASMRMSHSDVEPALDAGAETALDAALEALTRTGWHDVESAAAGIGDVRHLVTVAAELRRAVVAHPSPHAALRHRAVIARVARSLQASRSHRDPPVHVL